MQSPNPYEPTTLVNATHNGGAWRWAKIIAITGVLIGVALPIANLIYVFAYLWSRPPLEPGFAYSGTSGVAAIFLAIIGCPLLGFGLGVIGGLLGGTIDRLMADRRLDT